MINDFYQLQKHAPSPEELIAGRGQNFVIITSLDRQRRAINRQWAQIHGAYDTAIPQLRVKTIDSWTRDWWKAHRREHGGPTLLSPFAERLLWRDTLAQWSKREKRLLPIGELAELARQAYRLCLLFAINGDEPQFAETEDTYAFAQWQKQFSLATQKINGITLSEAACRLVDAPMVTAHTDQIYLIDEETHPLYQKLLRRFDVVVRPPAKIKQNHPAGQMLFPDSDAECEAVAHWSEQQWQQKPMAKLAVVANNIAVYRQPLRRALARVLAPSSLTMQTDKKSLLSFGRTESLAEEPRIATALAILNWNRRYIDSEEFFAVLESGCWAGNNGIAQAKLQKHLRRKYCRTTYTLGQIIKQCEYCADQNDDETYQLYLALDKFATLGGGNKGQTLSSWATQFRQQLAAVAWRGGEMAERLEQIFHQLDCDSRKFAQQNINTVLSLMADEAARAQQNNGGGLLDALGPQEAAGEPFDAIWVVGATDEQWPSSPAPNPLLPLSLQIAKDIPRSSAAQELRAAEAACRQLLQTAPMVVSAPKMDGERECAMWSFFAHLPVLPSPNNPPSRWTIWQQNAQPKVEAWTPGAAPAVDLADENIYGGTAIISQQQECPFAAFAIYRLGAEPLATTDIGIDPRDWGSFIHRAMELLWRDLQNWQALQNATEAQKQEAIITALTTAFDEKLRGNYLGARWRAMELRRATDVVTEWLTLENKRDPFMIHEIEGKHELTLGGLTLRLRVDRVDTMADEHLAVLDYKTGRKKSALIWSPPMREPQLPLYALLDDNVRAIGIGYLNNDDPGFTRIDESYDKDGMTWDERKALWRQELTALATDFMMGKAEQKGDHNTYRQNGLRLLARHQYREHLVITEGD